MTLRAVGIALALALVIWLVAVQMPTSPAGNSEVVQGFRHPKGFDAFLVRSLSKTPDVGFHAELSRFFHREVSHL
jgi:hypothetical protein